MGSYFTVVLVQ